MKFRSACTGLALRIFLMALAAGGAVACNPSRAPDPLKAQRQGLDQAKAVESILQKQAEDQRRAIDAAGR